MSREKGQDAEEKKAAPEAPQEDAAFERQLEEMMNGTGGKKAGKKKRGKKKFLLAAAVLAVLGIGAVKVLGGSEPSLPTAATVTPVRKELQNRLSVSGPGFRHRQCGRGIQPPCRGAGDPCKGRR